MANTKTHPGMFRCYEAALPDEPMFVILGRDPAGPATLEFWANERNRQGKTTNPDDNARIGAALREADEMRDWRKKIMDHANETGEPPAWKLPRPEEHGEDRPVRMMPELGTPYGLPPTDIATDPTVREKIAIGLKQVVAGMSGPNIYGMETFIDRINGYIAELEASRVDPYETFAAHMRRQQEKPLSYLWSPGGDADEIRVTPLSFTRMSELLDYATCYGEFDEHTPNGTISKYGEGMSSPMNDIRRHAIWIYKRCMGIPVTAEPPVADEAPKPVSRDVTEIDQPEMPPHRFAMFDKGKGWAYGRGLEISPSHIPAMLDRMEADGYMLVAALGSQADKVGMIFQRGPRYSAFELAHGFGGGFEDTRPRRDDGPVKWPADFKGTEIDCVKEIKALDARESAGLIDPKEAAAERARLVSDCPEWGRGLAI